MASVKTAFHVSVLWERRHADGNVAHHVSSYGLQGLTNQEVTFIGKVVHPIQNNHCVAYSRSPSRVTNDIVAPIVPAMNTLAMTPPLRHWTPAHSFSYRATLTVSIPDLPMSSKVLISDILIDLHVPVTSFSRPQVSCWGKGEARGHLVYTCTIYSLFQYQAGRLPDIR